MYPPNKLTPSGVTNPTTDPLYRSKTPAYSAGGSAINQPIPERMTSSIESKRKFEIIHKIENLFPFLQDIIGQNDARSNTIINRLIGLR